MGKARAVEELLCRMKRNGCGIPDFFVGSFDLCFVRDKIQFSTFDSKVSRLPGTHPTQKNDTPTNAIYYRSIMHVLTS